MINHKKFYKMHVDFLQVMDNCTEIYLMSNYMKGWLYDLFRL